MLKVKMDKLPDSCDDCPVFDLSGDYPYCPITQHSTGYTFPYNKMRMNDCPLSDIRKKGGCTYCSGNKPYFFEVTNRNKMTYLFVNKDKQLSFNMIEPGCETMCNVRLNFCPFCGAQLFDKEPNVPVTERWEEN